MTNMLRDRIAYTIKALFWAHFGARQLILIHFPAIEKEVGRTHPPRTAV